MIDNRLIISGAEIIDGVSEKPLQGHSIVMEGGRIQSVGLTSDLRVSESTQVVDARGKFVIPGLMNANVHLLCDTRVETLARHVDQFDKLIAEAAQVALKNGLTTVFDTWGPRRFLRVVQDRINAGAIPGSRIFCAGNIIGFDGPFSGDFHTRASELASAAFVQRINALWVENVGRNLMWLTPGQVASEVRAYIGRGVDFIKYGSNDHFPAGSGAFLAFSPEAQRAIVEEARRAKITAQAHTMSVEGLRVAVQAGCNIIQHANITGPVPIPETTLDLIVATGVGAVVFPWTERGLEWLRTHLPESSWKRWQTSDVNVQALIRSGAKLLLANDGALFSADSLTDPTATRSWLGVPEPDSLISLSGGHFTWFRAMEEKGCRPLDMLRAATVNIATAYGMSDQFGSLEVGKVADAVILNKNPLAAAENYNSIHAVIKNGVVIDRAALPVEPILTRPLEASVSEERSYAGKAVSGGFPLCGCC